MKRILIGLSAVAIACLPVAARADDQDAEKIKGLVPDPVTGERATPEPAIARQTIDTLEMLQRKTRGNLEPEEAKLFESLLYELRMHFLRVTGAPEAEG